ncbi:LIM domain-binding protein 3-like isoform X2 [Hypomesus transpacificus]|uniref:LIM domain-binding protein 3-like isoform X2 n=1 Tax=Hypomesus transpacificus TaxID=137520 RepID=UPI001F0758B6|nr:LIM domain-binding protein 3-like isoform X2 [Hypomesus transpacificus]
MGGLPWLLFQPLKGPGALLFLGCLLLILHPSDAGKHRGVSGFVTKFCSPGEDREVPQPPLPAPGVCPRRRVKKEKDERRKRVEREQQQRATACVNRPAGDSEPTTHNRAEGKDERRRSRRNSAVLGSLKLKMSTYTVTLSGPAPWGFRLQGGKDFNMPLTISRITTGSKAAGGSLTQGDIISSIDGISTDGMTHLEAQNKIKKATSKLVLTMHKSKRPNLSTGTPRMESPMSVIPHQKVIANTAANTEYVPSFNPIALKDSALSTHKPIEVRGPGGKATIVHAQYNTPISMYSQDAIMDAIAGQSQGKGHDGGPLPVKECVVDSASPVYQAVLKPNERNQDMSEWTHRAANLQSKSFRILAHITGTEYLQDPDEEALQRSREKFESEVKGPRFAKLKNWHHGLSAQILNIQE